MFSRRGLTRRERQLTRECEKLRGRVAEFRAELANVNATVQVQRHEIKLLSEVIARDRLRVQLEKAEAAQAVAATKGKAE